MLQINDISSGYGQNKILNNLSLECNTGDIHGILGWNGAGKTTFFNTVFGFIKPWSGSITLNGQPITKHDIAFLETDPYFYPNLLGREYLEMFAGKSSQSTAQWQTIFDLPLDDFIDGYSTGMLKKLAIAATFLHDRPVILFDEPFNGLDLESAEKLSWILEQTTRQQHKIILISSHILPTLTRICAKISQLEGGVIAYTYLPDEYPVLELQLKENIHQKLEKLMNPG